MVTIDGIQMKFILMINNNRNDYKISYTTHTACGYSLFYHDVD